MALPLFVPIGATIGATLIGAGALQKFGESTGLDTVADPVIEQFPSELQQEPEPVQDFPTNDGAGGDGGGFGGVILGLAVFIAVLVFGRTVIQEVI